MKQFHYMQAYTNSMINGITEFYSYDSHVADYIYPTRMVILYPKWQYSPTTIKQVKRFIKEYGGLSLSVYDLREAMKRIYEHNLLWVNFSGSDIVLTFRR